MIADVLTWICLVGGSVFLLGGGIGVLRFPDVYTRCHAAGLTDTLATILILFGLMIQAGVGLVTVKLVFMLIFIFFTSPTTAFALIHTAYATGLRPILSGHSAETGAPGDESASGDRS